MLCVAESRRRAVCVVDEELYSSVLGELSEALRGCDHVWARHYFAQRSLLSGDHVTTLETEINYREFKICELRRGVYFSYKLNTTPAQLEHAVFDFAVLHYLFADFFPESIKRVLQSARSVVTQRKHMVLVISEDNLSTLVSTIAELCIRSNEWRQLVRCAELDVEIGHQYIFQLCLPNSCCQPVRSRLSLEDAAAVMLLAKILGMEVYTEHVETYLAGYDDRKAYIRDVYRLRVVVDPEVFLEAARTLVGKG